VNNALFELLVRFECKGNVIRLERSVKSFLLHFRSFFVRLENTLSKCQLNPNVSKCQVNSYAIWYINIPLVKTFMPCKPTV